MSQKYTDPMYTKKYKKPMYARVLGWAANWEPKKGSLTEALLQSAVLWGVAGLKVAEALLVKNRQKNKIED